MWVIKCVILMAKISFPKTCPEMYFSGNFPGGHRVPQ